MSANRSFFRNAFDRFVEARMRQAEHEIALRQRAGMDGPSLRASRSKID